MSSVKREAAKDAKEAAAAYMSYGEGAGTRRKLIATAVEYKDARIPGYGAAFDQAYAAQDMTKHVKNAKRTRVAKDVGAVAGKNVRALARGDKNGMSAPLVIAIVVAGVAHKTGYDKKALDYTKRKSNDVRAWLKRKL